MSTTLPLSRRSLFTGIAAAAIVPMLPRNKSPIVRGWDFGSRDSQGWGVYDDSFLGRITYAHGPHRLLSSDIR